MTFIETALHLSEMSPVDQTKYDTKADLFVHELSTPSGEVYVELRDKHPPPAPPGYSTSSISAWRRNNTSPLNRMLESLDARLNRRIVEATDQAPPVPTLVRHHGDQTEPVHSWEIPGGSLVLVHGIFSSTEALWPSLRDAGYVECYGINYPSVSSSPISNAAQIAHSLRIIPREGAPPVTFVCHSQGGLVARWLTCFRPDLLSGARRIHLGSPHEGSSIVSADNINGALDHLASYSRGLAGVAHLAAHAVPFFAGVAGVFSATSFAASVLRRTPAADLIVQSCPALAAMQSGRNNLDARNYALLAGELARTHEDVFIVGAYSSPSSLAMRAAYSLAPAIFGSEDNDLVVDTALMYPRNIGVDTNRIHRVNAHHCEYLSNDEVRRLIRVVSRA